jgi:ABC-type antimicrobial peptide transport system permease subunit
MAKQFWPHKTPVGRGFNWGGRHLTVIGVVADVHIEGMDRPVAPTIYNCVYQLESGATTSAVFIIRTKDVLNLLSMVAAARNQIWSVDRGLPIVGFSTLHQVVSASLAIRRASLVLVGGFALLAMILSLIGIYGVLSQAVTQRTPEMGIRLAVGAKPREIVSLVMGEGLRLVVLGIVLGTGAGAIAAESIAKLLFNVPVLDPFSFGVGIVLLLAVSVLASYLPARRASHIDPMVALRYE